MIKALRPCTRLTHLNMKGMYQHTSVALSLFTLGMGIGAD